MLQIPQKRAPGFIMNWSVAQNLCSTSVVWMQKRRLLLPCRQAGIASLCDERHLCSLIALLGLYSCNQLSLEFRERRYGSKRWRCKSFRQNDFSCLYAGKRIYS